MRSVVLAIVVAFAAGALVPRPARAEVSEAEPRSDDEFDFMNLLTRHHLHDLNYEQWNVYGQLTWISSFKLPFSARYTNLNGSTNSLLPDFEHSFTGTVTVYLGARLWHGAQAWVVPEVISERPLSNLLGLGGVIQNFELQKQGEAVPTLYTSRLYLQQTFELGGADEPLVSNPQQLGGPVKSRRLVLTFGNFSILDFFDKNSFAGDLRRQFFNMAFLTYAAYDFAADARGYTWGLVGELYWDAWAARVGWIVPPQNPNQLPLDFRFWQYFGAQVEIEHDHTLWGRPGAVRLLGYLNRENMARFDDAVAAFEADPTKNATTCPGFNYGSHNSTAPDLCWARKPNLKMGIGVNVEQVLYRDIGLFLRGMYSDGQTEVYSFTATDASLSFGILSRGSLWRRKKDYLGVGFGVGWISQAHARYLALGGIDGFIGDGAISQAAESVFETFYGVNILSSVWLSADYQLISNPAYNADRGPVHILGVRAHAEF